MRIGVLLDRLDPTAGGAEAHTDALVRRMLVRGLEVRVAHLVGTPPPGATSVPLGRVPVMRPARDRHLAVVGERALRDAGCDVVFAVRHALACDVYLPHGGLVADAYAARDASRGGAGFLSRLAAGLSRKRRFFLRAEQALLSNRAGPRVVAVSRALAMRIASVYPAARGRVTVVPNGVDTDRFRRVTGPEAAAARLATRAAVGVPADAYVGLLLAHEPWLKGFGTLLAALARDDARARLPGFHLVVAGRRTDGALRRAVARAGVGDRVRLAGPVDDPRPLYAAADVVVQPTWFDPCSLTCLEALAMGVPVVTTQRNGASELMGLRGGIAIERPGDPEAVVRALEVLADPDLRRVTGDDARYQAMKTRLVTRLDQVIDVCLGPAAPAKAVVREVDDEGPPADPSLAAGMR